MLRFLDEMFFLRLLFYKYLRTFMLCPRVVLPFSIPIECQNSPIFCSQDRIRTCMGSGVYGTYNSTFYTPYSEDVEPSTSSQFRHLTILKKVLGVSQPLPTFSIFAPCPLFCTYFIYFTSLSLAYVITGE